MLWQEIEKFVRFRETITMAEVWLHVQYGQ